MTTTAKASAQVLVRCWLIEVKSVVAAGNLASRLPRTTRPDTKKPPNIKSQLAPREPSTSFRGCQGCVRFRAWNLQKRPFRLRPKVANRGRNGNVRFLPIADTLA